MPTQGRIQKILKGGGASPPPPPPLALSCERSEPGTFSIFGQGKKGRKRAKGRRQAKRAAKIWVIWQKNRPKINIFIMFSHFSPVTLFQRIRSCAYPPIFSGQSVGIIVVLARNK